MEKMLNIKINKIPCTVPYGTTILEAARSIGIEVPTLCFLKDMGDFAAFNAVYARYFTGNPARSCVAVAALPKGALVEVEVVAEI